MTESRDDLNDKAWEAALDWLLRVNEKPDDPALARRFMRWLEADETHRRAYEEARLVWTLTGKTSPARIGGGVRRALPQPRRTHVVAGLAAASLALLLLSSTPEGTGGRHTTAAGETRLVALEDGSRIHLGPDTSVAPRIGAAGRSAEVVRGQAFFRIEHDPDRVFVVRAGPVSVRVVGTAFDVRTGESATAVAVREGRVAVSVARDGAVERHSLAAGDTIRIDSASGTAWRGIVQTDQVASWRQGKLVVDRWTVAETVAAIARYRRGYVLVADGALAARSISGVFDLSRPADAIRAVVRPYYGRVTEITPYLLVISSR